MRLLGLLGFCDGKRWSNRQGGTSPVASTPLTVLPRRTNEDGSGIPSSASSARHRPEGLEGLRRIGSDDLERLMQEASEAVKPWESGRFSMVGKLQDAIRNKGQVDEMRRHGPDGEVPVAVKRMPTSWVTRGPKEFQTKYPTAPERPWCDIALVRELHHLGHSFVCESQGVFRDSESTYVVVSLATRGDLFGWCDGDPLPGLAREAVMQPLLRQIFEAVRVLHDVGIAHRDLSLENILLTDVGRDLQIKIIDFGMCTTARTATREVRGKQSYQAPEMHLDQPYDTFLSDAFALGVTAFAMAAQDYPWTSTKRNACQLHEYVLTFGFRKFLERRKLRKGKGEHLIDVFSPALVDLIDGLVARVPGERTSLGEECFSRDATGNHRRSVWDMPWVASSI